MTVQRIRLDKWLWMARFHKTRTLAAEAVDGGRVQVGGERVRRSRLVGVGDEIRIRNGALEWIVTIRDIPTRRGPPAEAAALYEEDPGGKVQREQRAAELKAAHAVNPWGGQKPTKQDRRTLQRLRRK